MPPDLLEVGRIAKPHGVRGEVVVELITDRTERLAPGSVLQSDAGALVVVSARPHQHRWLVHFEGYADRTSVQPLAGLVLRAEPLPGGEGELWVHELIGATVREVDGTERGSVVAVVANPAHDLLELVNGALVPVVFVTSFADGIVTIAPPAGLFE